MDNTMGMEEPMGSEMEMEEPMDGGIQDDENVDDPKKNIQRLAGELSQALRMYNQEQEKPDTDLNKYVIGMIATQAAKNMTSDEKQEVVKKIQKGETIEDVEDTNDEPVEDVPMEECKQNNVMDDDKKGKRYEKKSFDFGKNPFSSKR